MEEKKKWRDLPIGGIIITSGNAAVYQTGNWRTEKPVIDLKRCTNCMICWVYCPEGVILAKDGKIIGIDLEHCKGCGICSVECPTKVIEMVKESEKE
jgi:2-oxoacid:acceptor oxidoreductase delta subunit (pyruvate/2-ketoisovalerate family)